MGLLQEAGVTLVAGLRGRGDEELLAIRGIGQRTLRTIRLALGAEVEAKVEGWDDAGTD